MHKAAINEDEMIAGRDVIRDHKQICGLAAHFPKLNPIFLEVCAEAIERTRAGPGGPG